MADQAFWKDFLENTWECEPAHLGTAIEPLLAPEELFTLAVIVAEAVAGGDASLKVRWCDDGKKIRTLAPDPANAAVLPQRRDRSIEGYCRRMSEVETFFFQLPSLQRFHAALWPRIVRFCRNLYPHTGIPAHMAWTDAYFGRYASTPFGVHLDGASNFTFGVHGYKSLYLWEPEYYHAHMASAGAYDFDRFLPDAIKLTVGPGEVIYWPHRFYHIAIPDNRFSVTMNFAFYAERDHASWLQEAFRETIAGTHSKQPPLHGLKLPDQLAAACGAVVAKVSEGEFERHLLKELVAHCTRFGFLESPPLSSIGRIERGTKVFRTVDTLLVCVPDGRGSLILSSNGHTSDVPERESTRALINALNSGERVNVDSENHGILRRLHQWGAVERFWAEERV
jgi:hypothetical protein